MYKGILKSGINFTASNNPSETLTAEKDYSLIYGDLDSITMVQQISGTLVLNNGKRYSLTTTFRGSTGFSVLLKMLLDI